VTKADPVRKGDFRTTPRTTLKRLHPTTRAIRVLTVWKDRLSNRARKSTRSRTAKPWTR
jgi:hypothetical protein